MKWLSIVFFTLFKVSVQFGHAALTQVESTCDWVQVAGDLSSTPSLSELIVYKQVPLYHNAHPVFAKEGDVNTYIYYQNLNSVASWCIGPALGGDRPLYYIRSSAGHPADSRSVWRVRIGDEGAYSVTDITVICSRGVATVKKNHLRMTTSTSKAIAIDPQMTVGVIGDVLLVVAIALLIVLVKRTTRGSRTTVAEKESVRRNDTAKIHADVIEYEIFNEGHAEEQSRRFSTSGRSDASIKYVHPRKSAFVPVASPDDRPIERQVSSPISESLPNDQVPEYEKPRPFISQASVYGELEDNDCLETQTYDI